MDSREGLPGTAALKVQGEIEGRPNYVRKIFLQKNFIGELQDIFSFKNFTGQLFRYIVVPKVYGIGIPTPCTCNNGKAKSQCAAFKKFFVSKSHEQDLGNGMA